MTSPPEFSVAYDIEGAAAAVSLSSRHLRREIHAGKLRARMVDRKYRISRDDLQAWFNALPEGTMTKRIKRERPVDSPWFMLDEACAYARMGRDEMGDLLRSGALVGHQTKRGGRWRIHRDAIDAYLRDETYTTVVPAVARRRSES